MKNRFTRIALLLLWMLPLAASAQKPWRETIEVRDRRKSNETPVVANVTISAWWMTSRLSQGQPVMRGSDGKVDPIQFQGQPESYLKFKIEEVKFVDPAFDKSPEFKVIMRSMWVDLQPRPFDEKRADLVGMSEAQKRKLYITAPNMEHEEGDSMPPPIIFKIDRSNRYTFNIGFTTITPETDKEKPWDFKFTFVIDGLLRNGAGWGQAPPPVEKEDSIPVVKAPVKERPKKDSVEVNTDEIDAAVQKAIAEEDVEELKRLMNEFPKVKSVIDARKYLELAMRRELVDSTTYQVDIYYKRFTKALPTEKDLALSMAHAGGPYPLEGISYWRNGKFFVSPPYDSTDYTLSAVHRMSAESRASIELNAFKDFINFVYADTLDGESVVFKIKGGKGPYALHIQKLTGEFYFDHEGSIKIYGDTVLTKDRIARILNLSEEGDYRFFVEDADQLKKTGRNLVHIVPPPPIPPFVWYILGSLLFLAFIIFLLWRRERRRRDEEMDKLLAARGGADPRVKRKPRPDLKDFWKETAISELSLHKNFIREVGTYLKERKTHPRSGPMIEGVILGTVLKFDFETEQYEVRLDRFRAMDSTRLDHYDDKPGVDRWPAIREISADHKDLVRIGWLQVVDGGQMALTHSEVSFMDEQFSELFQLCLKIDIEGKERMCGFFTRTIAGKVNNAKDRQPGVDYWLDWDNLENAGYYENKTKGDDGAPAEGGVVARVKTNTKTA